MLGLIQPDAGHPREVAVERHDPGDPVALHDRDMDRVSRASVGC